MNTHHLAVCDLMSENGRLRADLTEAQEVLSWYGEQARLARLIHSEGDVGRAALSADGGNRARALLDRLKVDKT